METVYLLRGTEIKREDNTLRVTLDNGKRVRLPAETIQHMIMTAGCQVNTEVLSFMGQSGIRVSFVDYYGNIHGFLEPTKDYGSGVVHLAQAKIILNTVERIRLAKILMGAAAHNLLQNLRYYRYRGIDLESAIQAITTHRDRMLHAKSIEQLMGSEGLMRQVYYAAWGKIDPRLSITKRTKRPPTDRINALISFLNSLVYSACRNALAMTHLDVTLSIIHAPTQSRASLALDLAEIFKPVLADRIIFRMVRKDELTDNDFDEQEGICLLSVSGKRLIVDAFRQEMDHTQIDGHVGYRSIILREAYRLESHILGMVEYQPYKRRS